jgi:hypothetical protein
VSFAHANKGATVAYRAFHIRMFNNEVEHPPGEAALLAPHRGVSSNTIIGRLRHLVLTCTLGAKPSQFQNGPVRPIYRPRFWHSRHLIRMEIWNPILLARRNRDAQLAMCSGLG